MNRNQAIREYLMGIKTTLTTEDREVLKKEIGERAKLPCGHFVENAVGFGIMDWAPDFVCAACIHEGKSLREAFEVCAILCEDRKAGATAQAIRDLAKQPEEIAIRKALVQAQGVEQSYGDDAALAFIVSDTSSDSIPVNDSDLDEAAEDVEREAGVHPDTLKGEEQKLARALEIPHDSGGSKKARRRKPRKRTKG